MSGSGPGSRLVELVDDAGAVVAQVSSRAASLRGLSVDGVPIVESTAARTAPPGMSGAVLVPWPNRVDGASWTHEGRRLQLPVTEPELGNALHGLLADTDYAVAESDRSHAVFVARIEPQGGYPFELEVTVGYTLRPRGLRCEIAIANPGAVAAPVAVGAHPYLRIGDWPLESLTVSVDADVEWELDERHLPSRRREGTNPRAEHGIHEVPSHILYERWPDARGVLVHALTSPDGRVVELRADAELRWTQWYLSSGLDTDDGIRPALAIEPMSAPPNALRTGESLRMLAPGGIHRWGWELRLR